MSVQFGAWNFEGQQPASEYIAKVNAVLAPYGPDGNETYSSGGVKILYRAFHTTKESRRETQPHISPRGAIITWDGRLDNRAELISQLRDPVSVRSTDVQIVGAAFERWGDTCFAKLVGDWALSIWNPNNRSLILAKDPIGARHLYYSIDRNQVVWSTVLDPLVLFASKTLEICEEYIAGWLATMFPAAHLTPYVGIHAVSPSSAVVLGPGKHSVSKSWDFDPVKQIHYRSDAEYEEHFRAVFATAIERRLRSDQPVLAELSGGMDSSSIVCMADIVMARGAAETPRLDTISWYDDSNPALDERPYFTKVEEKRGHSGCHIDLGGQPESDSQESFTSDSGSDHFAATPIVIHRNSEHFKQYAAHLRAQDNRVVLSGVGGDDVTGGGAATPIPELQNLLARVRFFTLSHRLHAWAHKLRKPRLSLLWDAARGFFPLILQGMPKHICIAPWFPRAFVRRNHAAIYGYPFRMKFFGALPSFQTHVSALNLTRRILSYYTLHPESLYELRFPYLDRDFLEFMHAIPWEQLVRVGQRRSLMKRALVGIVPAELLNRKQTIPVQQRSKQESAKNTWAEPSGLLETGQHMVGSSIGIMDTNRFVEALHRARRNEDVPISILRRTLTLESWLRHLTIHKVLTDSRPTTRQGDTSSLGRELHTRALSSKAQLASCVRNITKERR
jgi:asparagine synthase (glutamine-hydrolysing)